MFEFISSENIISHSSLSLEKIMWTFGMDIFDDKEDLTAKLKKGKKYLTSGKKTPRRKGSYQKRFYPSIFLVSFYKAGVCSGKSMLCVARSSTLSTTIKAYEFVPTQVIKKKGLSKVFGGGKDPLKFYKVIAYHLQMGRGIKILANLSAFLILKDFSIPVEVTSIYYLKTKLCLGCDKGFEVIDVESYDTQSLIDPEDKSLDFVKKDSQKPLAVYRIRDGEFLLCHERKRMRGIRNCALIHSR